MTFPLPDTSEMEGERMLLVPAGWHGKRPTASVPLTSAWIKAQIVSGTIVPPRGSGPDTMGVWLRLLAWASFLGLCSLPWLFNLWR